MNDHPTPRPGEDTDRIVAPKVRTPRSQDSVADLEQEEEENLRRFQGPRRSQERRHERPTWQHPFFWVPTLAVFMLGGAIAIGCWFFIRHNEAVAAKARKEREDKESMRVIEAAINEGENRKRLKAAKLRLEKLQSAAPATIQVKRQFGVDAETGLPQWEVAVLGHFEMSVLLAEREDFNYGTLIGDRKVARIDRRQVSVRHTSGSGDQSTSLEYTDVYIVVTPARIAELEKLIKTLESSISDP